MADTATQVARVVGRLRARGFKVVGVDGWETRGKEAMTTRARIEHHTAGGSGDTASLRVVTFGREGLRNSLSRWYVSRSGVIYLIALRTSWHAGAGTQGTNSTLSGTEAEHSGSRSEPWPAAVLDAMEAISQEEIAEFGLSPGHVFEHKEHAGYRGKVDRIAIDGDEWRARLAEEDDMVKPTDWDDRDVDRVQAVLAQALVWGTDKHVSWHLRRIEALSTITANRIQDFGPLSDEQLDDLADAVAEAVGDQDADRLLDRLAVRLGR